MGVSIAGVVAVQTAYLRITRRNDHHLFAVMGVGVKNSTEQKTDTQLFEHENRTQQQRCVKNPLIPADHTFFLPSDHPEVFRVRTASSWMNSLPGQR